MEKIINKFKSYFIIISFLLIVFIEFRGLIFNINKAFVDWGDTSFISWQITITRDKLLNLDFKNIDTTNSHYPYQGSLYFTDSFIGQSIIAISLFFIKNPILVYNIIFIITILLNYYSSYLLFKKLTNSEISGFLGSIFLNNSVYFFDQIIHLQTITYWPMILLLYFLLKKKPFLAGIYLSIQFYMAVYLGIFSFFLVGIYYAIYFFFNIKEIKTIIVHTFILGGIFFLLTYPFLIKKYLDFQKTYHQVRDMNEIIANSGNITDYQYFLPKTLFSKIPIVEKYNQNVRFTTERMSFPGIIIMIGALFGIFTYKTKKKSIYLLFFLALIGLGFVFSLGPRLMINGQYKILPLPYLLFLKQFEFLFSIRLTHRWAIFLIIGLVYFSSKYYSKLSKSFIFVILILFFIESVPKIDIKIKPVLNEAYQFLISKKLNNKVLLEYPLLSFEKGVGVDDETIRLISSVYHKMRLFNGYTGLFISDYGTTRIYLEKFFPDILTDKMLKAIGIEYIKIDKKFISKDELSKIKSFYNKKIIFENNQALTIKLDKNNDLATINNIELGFTGDHAYGKDRKLYINLLFKNNSKKYFANKNQDKIKLLLTFYRDEKIVRKKEIFNLYPLLIYPEQNRQVTFDIYEKPGFNKLRIDIFNVNKHVSSLTSKL